MIVASFQFRGRWFVVTESGTIFMLETKGSEHPTDWIWTSVADLP
jgi:hypothetical protein